MDDICEIIIGNNEIEYSSYGNLQKSSFILKKKLEIASNVISKENYSKQFTTPLIQAGFQNKNVFSFDSRFTDTYLLLWNESGREN